MVPAPALGFRWVLVPGAKRAERTELTADWMIDHARSKSCWPRSATIPEPVEPSCCCSSSLVIWGILTSSNR
jgi:hypothetical protein